MLTIVPYPFSEDPTGHVLPCWQGRSAASPAEGQNQNGSHVVGA